MAFINDGHPTYFSFAENPTLKFKEKSVTPPSLDGGGPNDTTTMRNTTYRTRQPKKLKTMGESTVTASYDPEVYNSLWSMLNVNQIITITFPDGSEVAFWGWLNALIPGEHVEGAQPTATVSIICSNQDNDGNEVAPVYTAP